MDGCKMDTDLFVDLMDGNAETDEDADMDLGFGTIIKYGLMEGELKICGSEDIYSI